MNAKEPPKLEHIAPPWFHKKWDELLKWCQGNIPVQGPGIGISDAPGGGKLIQANKRFFASYAPAFNSKIIRAAGTGVEKTSVVIKVSSGTILLSEAWDDRAIIENITDEFTLSATGQAIWIEMTVPASGIKEDITFITRFGDLWDDFPKAFVHTGEEGTEEDDDSEEDHSQVWYQLICRLEESNSETDSIKLNGSNCTLVQKTKTDLIIRRDICANQDGDKKNTIQLWPWHQASGLITA